MEFETIDSKANEYVKFFLSKFGTTALNLNKLLYITQCITYANPAFEDYRLDIEFKAMKNDPIYPMLYNEFRIYCANKIEILSNPKINLNQNAVKLLCVVVDKYKKIGPWNFIKFIHREGGAWRNACKDFVLPNGAWDEKRFASFEKVYINLSLDDMKIDREMFLKQ